MSQKVYEVYQPITLIPQLTFRKKNVLWLYPICLCTVMEASSTTLLEWSLTATKYYKVGKYKEKNCLVMVVNGRVISYYMRDDE